MLKDLLTQLTSSDSQQCLDAIQQIGDMAQVGEDVSKLIPILLGLLENDNSKIRKSAIWALGYSNQEGVIKTIESVLTDEENRPRDNRDLDIITKARMALKRLSKVRQENDHKRFMANLEKDLQEEREKPRYQAIVTGEVVSVAMGGGQSSANKEITTMSNEEKNSANQENQTTTSGTVSNTANATANGGTAIATAGNNNRVSSTITQSQGENSEWLKSEMLKWLQKADELIKSQADIEEVKGNIERIANEIDKNDEKADEERVERQFFNIWSISKDVGKVILSGLEGGPLAVVKKVAQLIQHRIAREKQEQVE